MRDMLVLLLSLMSFSWGASVKCDIKTLTRNCEALRAPPTQNFIELPDATRIKNPFFVGPANQGVLVSLPPPGFEKTAEMILDVQTEILYNPNYKGSPRFKTSLANPLNLIAMCQHLEMNLPWPAEDPNAKIRSVPFEEFERGYLSHLDPKSRTDLNRQLNQISSVMQTSAHRAGPPGTDSTDLRKKYGITPDREKRVDALIEETRSLLLDEITRGRPVARLTHDERAMVEKIKSVKILPLNEDLALSPRCAGDNENAFYDPLKHSLAICPVNFRSPDSSLVNSIAHEMAHSVDSCNLHAQLIRYKRDIKFEEMQRLAVENKLPPPVEFMQSAPSGTIKAGSMENRVIRSDRETAFLSVLVQANAVERVSEGLPNNRNPYSPALRCLQDRMGLRKNSTASAREYLKEWVNQRKNFIRLEPSVIDSTEEMISRSPGCVSAPNAPSQLQEAAADLWAAKTVGRYLEKYPPKTELEKLAFYSAGLTDVCGQFNPALAAMDSHPSNRKRFDMIFLSDERIQNIFGCEGSSKDYCLRSVGTNPTPKTKDEIKAPGTVK